MKQTTFDEFVELSRRGTFVPVVKEIMADLLTPVSAFLKIAEPPSTPTTRSCSRASKAGNASRAIRSSAKIRFSS
jgi:hypothetical protein